MALGHAFITHDQDPAIGLQAEHPDKSRLVRGHSLVTTLLDDTEDEAIPARDYFSLRRRRASSVHSKHYVSISRHLEHSGPTGNTTQAVSSTIGRIRGPAPLFTERRDTSIFPYGYAVSTPEQLDRNLRTFNYDQSQESDSTQERSAGSTGSLVTSLKDFITSRPVASHGNKPASSSQATQLNIHSGDYHHDISASRSQTPPRPQDTGGEVTKLRITIAFHDPFRTPRRRNNIIMAQSCNVSPRSIV